MAGNKKAKIGELKVVHALHRTKSMTLDNPTWDPKKLKQRLLNPAALA
jgi:hypothetical protein